MLSYLKEDRVGEYGLEEAGVEGGGVGVHPLPIELGIGLGGGVTHH